MTDKKDNDNANPMDDLLEGFDDSFDEEIGNAIPIDDSQKTFKDKKPDGAVSEVFQDPDKTEFVADIKPSQEQTQMADADNDTVVSLESQGGLESEGDLSSSGLSDSPGDFLVPEDLPSDVVKTEIFPEFGASDPIVEEKKTEESSVAAFGETHSADLASLIEEEISAGHGGPEGEMGKTEDLDSAMEDQEISRESSSKFVKHPPSKSASNFPEPPPVKTAKNRNPKISVESQASDSEDISYVSSQTQTIKTRVGFKKYIRLLGMFLVLVLVAILGWMGWLKIKTSPDGLRGIRLPWIHNKEEGQKPKINDEVLRDLDERYNQTAQYFVSDRFRSYTEATNQLEEILNVHPDHIKANSRLAEAILLKFDGYLDRERKNRVAQLMDKANELDSGSIETFRTKARLLMVEDKLKDASVRVQQAIGLDAKDAEAIQTSGEIKMAEKDYQGAIEQFSKAIELKPNYIRAKYFYYLALKNLGKVKDAKAGFTTLASDMNVHPKSNIEKYGIDIREKNVEKDKNELRQYLTTQENEMSPFEIGYGWKILSDAERSRKNIQGSIEALEKAVSKMALNKEYTFELGNLYFGQKNYEKASQHYATSVTLDPENTEYLFQLGISLREQGRLKEAEETLKRVTTKEPKNLEAQYQYALARYKLGFVDETATMLETTIKENPGFLRGKILLGTIQLEKNDTDKALANFQAALSAKDKETATSALVAMGNYYMKHEQWIKARQYFDQAQRKNPGNSDVHLSLAKIAIQLNHIPEAKKHIQYLEKINPGSLDAKMLQGDIFARQRSFDKAIELYTEVLKSRENDYQTLISVAKIYMEKKQYTDALASLHQAYKYNANHYNTYYYMGIVQRELGNMTESERNFNTAISMAPKFYKGYYELGVMYLRKDDLKKAEEKMNESLKLEPTFTPPLEALGDFYFERTVYDQAANYYQQVLKIQPNRADTMLKLAKSYREMQNDKKAIAYFQKIIQLKPTDPSVYYELGVIYEEANDPNQALKLYQRSIALAPKDPKPYYQLGFLYKQLNQKAKAIAAFKTYLDLSPNALDRPDIEDEIEILSGKRGR